MPVPTPAANTSRAPTGGELATYETGTDRFPNLGALGSFRCWDWQNLPGVNNHGFNCFAWSVGFTDRWIQGGSRGEMQRLYQAYFYIPCQPAQAEVELYDIPDAPPQLSRTVQRRNQPPSVITWDNPKAVVMHAHRRDNPNLDAAGQGCSSKMGNGSLIAHNRHALEDRRPWGSTNPQIMYGTIYQYWRRDPGQHPAFPGNEANVFPAPGHYPFDPIFSQGTGTYPPGHPGNNTGLPGTANNGGGGGGAAGGATQAKNLSSKFAGLSLGSKSSKPTKQAPPPSIVHAYSGKPYPRLLNFSPFAKIPSISSAAAAAAAQEYKHLAKADKDLVSAFEARWAAWIKVWQRTPALRAADDASVATQTQEFNDLAAMGPAIVPLVVYKLAAEPYNFIGVFLYNALERDRDYRVHPKDLLNSKVFPRHGNLIVEMNAERRAATAAAAQAPVRQAVPQPQHHQQVPVQVQARREQRPVVPQPVVRGQQPVRQVQPQQGGVVRRG